MYYGFAFRVDTYSGVCEEKHVVVSTKVVSYIKEASVSLTQVRLHLC